MKSVTLIIQPQTGSLPDHVFRHNKLSRTNTSLFRLQRDSFHCHVIRVTQARRRAVRAISPAMPLVFFS